MRFHHQAVGLLKASTNVQSLENNCSPYNDHKSVAD